MSAGPAISPRPSLRLYAGSLDDFRPTLQLALEERIKLLWCATNYVRRLRLRDRFLHAWHLQNLVEDAVDPCNQSRLHARWGDDAVPDADIESRYGLPDWRRVRQLRHWLHGNSCKSTNFALFDLTQRSRYGNDRRIGIAPE